MLPLLLCMHFSKVTCICRWQAANGLPGLSNIYLAAMDALNQLDPQALFFLQGAGQTALTRSPGDGFVTDTATLQKYNFSDPSSFFKTLLVRPYVNQVSQPSHHHLRHAHFQP
jgi:hypothetical protein